MHSKKISFWLGDNDNAIYCTLNTPASLKASKTGVIICNASGHEYTHSHLAVRHLAQHLASNGYPTLRFDYHGTGDSPGNAFLTNRIETWLDNIERSIIALKKLGQVEQIALCGLRMGGSLASLYSENKNIDYLILWNPCINGKSYIRDMQILSSSDSQNRNIDAGGFIITAETAEQYNNINLQQTKYQVSNKILLLTRNDIPSNNRLCKHIESLNIPVDEIETPGYAQMMQQPQFSVSPDATLNQISQWLKQNTPQNRFMLPDPNDLALNTKITSNSDKYRESICQFGKEKKLLGILTQPLAETDYSKPLILISNTGAAHHVGPNRLHVELSRALAKEGFASMRFDLGNLGDSVSGKPLNENHPYPHNMNNDIHAALSYLANHHGFKRFIPAGLCSGANAAFHCGLNEHDFNIPETILINPLIFYWQEGLSLATPEAVSQAVDQKYYSRSIRDPKKWLKLLKGQANLSYITKFIIKRIKNITGKPIKRFAEVTGLSKPSKLSRDLYRYTELKRHLSLFISSNDPGYDLIMSDAARTAKRKIKRCEMDVYFINNADHTFISKTARDCFLEKFVAHINKRYH